jgi:YbbR domain-containing protein
LEYILPTDMMFADRPVHEVTFLIEGPRAFVRTVTERDDKLVIDLNRTSRKQQNFNIDINPAQLNLPFGMVVERVIPRRLSIKLEKKASKIVPLKLQFTGQLPDKLSLQNTSLEPSEVEVTGPRTIINKLKHLSVRAVDLDHLPSLEESSLDIMLPDDRLSLTGPHEAKFHYQLKASTTSFSLKDLPIRFLTDKRKIESETRRATVKIHVPDKIIRGTNNVTSSVQVWADIPKEARGRVEVPLKVVLPPGLHLIEVSPKTIIVNIQ